MPPRYPAGARLLARPSEVAPCPACGDLLGRGYPTCPACVDGVDAYWRADWTALLAAEKVTAGGVSERTLATLVIADAAGIHPWTCVDWAMRLLVCDRCGSEVGTGDPACVACTVADQARWEWDHAGMPDAMTPNEHALRVAVAVLRAPHRRRDTVVAFHRLSLPFLLAGETTTPAQAQRIKAHVLAERVAELAGRESYSAMAALPDLPWRIVS